MKSFSVLFLSAFLAFGVLPLHQASYAQDEVITEVAIVDSVSTSTDVVKPELEVISTAITMVKTYFPKAGPVIQLVTEVLFGISTLFTLLTAFLIGVLKIPVIAARIAGANEMADKIQKFADKIIPFFKYLSIFNSVKKK